MAEEVDYTTLPLEERLDHKVWKARLSAYEELSKQFESSRNDQDTVFTSQSPDLFKRILTDSNVVAQEAGYKTFINYLTFGGNAPVVSRLVKTIGIVQPICEKGLSSSRKGTKDSAIESIMVIVEYIDNPDLIIEEIIPFLGNRLPKLVAGCVTVLAAIYENFGCKIVSPKIVIPSLGKLFAHADRNVRAETTKLAVELYKWMGDSLTLILFPDLKPVQQKDLTSAFEAVKSEKPQQKRLTKVQRDEIAKQEEASAASVSQVNEKDDVEMSDAALPDSNYDPLEFVDPVEVLCKLPNDFEAKVSSAKWKDRVEVLEEAQSVLEKAPKLIDNDDYAPLVRIFAKNMRDANIQVVQLAATCANYVAKGLGKNWLRYQSIILGSVIERTKEKKPSVALALDTFLDTMFTISGLSGPILEESVAGMKLKVPQNKIACANFLHRCLANTTKPPKSTEIDSIMAVGVKLLTDSQEPIRQAATEMIGTLMKITGERELNRFLENTDDNRKTKILKFYESVSVNCSSSQARSTPVSQDIPTKKPSSSRVMSLQGRSSTASSSTIPSKREASSPAKRTDDGKASNLGKGLTSRSLSKPTSTSLRPSKGAHSASLTGNHVNLSHPSTVVQSTPPPPQIEYIVDPKMEQELEQLRQDVKRYQAQQQQDRNLIQELNTENVTLKEEISSLNSRLENEMRSSSITISHKDTQVNNLKIELDKVNHKVKDLEAEREINKLQQSNQSYFAHETISPTFDGTNYREPDIRRGVHRLSITEQDQLVKPTASDGKGAIGYNRSSFHSISSNREKLDVDAGDDWKRAAEVTQQLKKRIERMKARARTPLNVE
ncbi:hypothetical protein CORT_0D01150 [Candida orthopsilosis Co 90-125]|uniref:TOG domain-containing protein n=1 Tax=Candida orthopsilosis (strain 90-125) TaxID=1136231 RepID=H8X4M1_CANO9|nr:hypothetical protein CORT_0D01150 [Candida orthopsilosis Co 90-125]CCG22963.1 hypothetical protein CORT_0D01150 [Candida orthopsilosis Co 90-125]